MFGFSVGFSSPKLCYMIHVVTRQCVCSQEKETKVHVYLECMCLLFVYACAGCMVTHGLVPKWVWYMCAYGVNCTKGEKQTFRVDKHLYFIQILCMLM